MVKELSEKDGNKELEKMAQEMLDTLRNEGGEEQIRIAYGTIVGDIKEVSKSYKKPSSRSTSERYSSMKKISWHLPPWASDV